MATQPTFVNVPKSPNTNLALLIVSLHIHSFQFGCMNNFDTLIQMKDCLRSIHIETYSHFKIVQNYASIQYDTLSCMSFLVIFLKNR